MPHVPNLARYRAVPVYSDDPQTWSVLEANSGKPRGIEVVPHTREDNSYYFGLFVFDSKKKTVRIGEEEVKEIPLKDITRLLVPKF